jgi:hypothetical protein
LHATPVSCPPTPSPHPIHRNTCTPPPPHPPPPEVSAAEGFGKARLFEIMDDLESKTRPINEAARAALAKDKGAAALEPHNIGYMLAGAPRRRRRGGGRERAGLCQGRGQVGLCWACQPSRLQPHRRLRCTTYITLARPDLAHRPCLFPCPPDPAPPPPPRRHHQADRPLLPL